MNMTDTVCTGERERAAYDNAYEQAGTAIYEQLKDLFGVQGENLAASLDQPAPPSADEARTLLCGLHAAYLCRVADDANRMLEGN